MNNQSWETTSMLKLDYLCFVVASFDNLDRPMLYRGGIPHAITAKLRPTEIEPVLANYLEQMDMDPIVGFNTENLWFLTNKPLNKQYAGEHPYFTFYWQMAEDIPFDNTNNLEKWEAAYADWKAG